ncbi:MAG: N-acetyltransferase [Actinobacteria bacterium]|nr:N-acetyltransferase [Actinomycetota bacterium]
MTKGLTTGWEPDVPVDDGLVRRFVFAYADRITAMARALGGRVDARPDARMADLGTPFGYDNAVVLLRPQVDLPAVVARAKEFFPPTRWWILLSMWPTPDLSGHGVTLVGHPPLMFRPPGPPPAPPPGLEVSAVKGPAALAEFTEVLTRGYPVPGGEGAVADPAVVGTLLHLFIGRHGGRAVSVAGAAVHHGIVEVDWVATLPEDRGHGWGAALTAAAVGVAPELPAMLIASDDGRSVYRRLGFLDLFRATIWEHNPG